MVLSHKMKMAIQVRMEKQFGDPFWLPKVISGAGTLSQLGTEARALGVKKLLVVTDAMLVDLGLVKRCTDILETEGISFAVYSKVVPNPPESNVFEAYEIFKAGCDSVLAIGGGSPMDVAKCVAMVAWSGGQLRKFEGALKVAGPVGWMMKSGRAASFPKMMAIPTTAGTGSENSPAAVISDTENHRKRSYIDGNLIPHAVILDAEITVGLPKGVTAATGMDALTHAVEAYLSPTATPFTRCYSLRAVQRIGRDLLRCYHDPRDLEAREGQLLASFEAGIAFGRAGVGIVHGIAHQLGGMFGTPHGEANALLLPFVLDWYLDTHYEKLAELGVAFGCEVPRTNDLEGLKGAARSFVEKVRLLSTEMAIPQTVKGMAESDVQAVTRRALDETHGTSFINLSESVLYMDKYMTAEECNSILRRVLPPPLARL